MIPIKNQPDRADREVNISEWNSEVRAFIKTLSPSEFMTVNDQFRLWSDTDRTTEERVEAALAACMMVLVDENARPLLSVDQMEELKNASCKPIHRIFTAVLQPDRMEASFQKN